MTIFPLFAQMTTKTRSFKEKITFFLRITIADNLRSQHRIPRVLMDQLPVVNMTPVAGQYYSFRRTTNGVVSVIKIINVTPKTISWDENHELAGKNLTFTLRLVLINQK